MHLAVLTFGLRKIWPKFFLTNFWLSMSDLSVYLMHFFFSFGIDPFHSTCHHVFSKMKVEMKRRKWSKWPRNNGLKKTNPISVGCHCSCVQRWTEVTVEDHVIHVQHVCRQWVWRQCVYDDSVYDSYLCLTVAIVHAVVTHTFDIHKTTACTTAVYHRRHRLPLFTTVSMLPVEIFLWLVSAKTKVMSF